MQQSNTEQNSRTNVVSFLPRHFTSQTDRVALSRAAGSLEEALEGAAALKDERFVSVTTRQMPLDVWNVVKDNICWVYSRGDANVKRAAIHAVIVEKGTLLLRGLSEYREVGSAAHQSVGTNFRKHRDFSFNQLDYRYRSIDLRSYRVVTPVSLRCQSGTKDLLEELAGRYHTSISMLAGMAMVTAFTTSVDEEIIPRELRMICDTEFESFKIAVGRLSTPVTHDSIPLAYPLL